MYADTAFLIGAIVFVVMGLVCAFLTYKNKGEADIYLLSLMMTSFGIMLFLFGKCV